MSDDVWRCVTNVEAGNSPPAVSEAAGAVVDTGVKKIAVLHGGWQGDVADCSNELWGYDLATKTWDAIEVDPTLPAPTPRSAHCIASCSTDDPYTNSLLLFGGEDSKHTLLSDTWILSVSPEGVWQWSLQEGGGPSARRGAAMVSTPGQCILFGGMDGKERLNDLFCFSVESGVWQSVVAAGCIPSARDAHSMAFSKELGISLMCGFDVADCASHHTLQITESEEKKPSFEWVEEVLSATAPPARSGGSLFYAPEGLVVFLGSHRGVCTQELAEVAELGPPQEKGAPAEWFTRPWTGESVVQPRSGHCTFAFESRAVVFGGCSGAEYLRSTVEFEFGRPAEGGAGKKK